MAVNCSRESFLSCNEPAYLTGLHGEGGEVPCPVEFSTQKSGRSSKLVRYAV